MSYIRCLSNPESLYIWADCDGRVSITSNLEDILSLPAEVFDEVLRRYSKGFTSIRYKGATLRPSRARKFRYSKHVLHYKDWPKGVNITAWKVTWCYIARNVERNS